MAWYDEQLWKRQREQMEREALAASVEEMTFQDPLANDDWNEESPSSFFQHHTAESPRLTQPVPSLRPQAAPMTRPIPAQRVNQQGQRLAGRSTRVRLQAVHTGPVPETSTGPEPFTGQANHVSPETHSMPRVNAVPAQDNANQQGEQVYARPWPRLLGGRGMLKQGQAAVTVPNASITERCVVTVMLTGNPGPVVVHYVSLHPRMGFTVHLTSQAMADASFNYVIWPF